MRNCVILNFREDGQRVTESGSHFIGTHILDTWSYNRMWAWLRAHIDGFQIVPHNHITNGQYSLAEIDDLIFKFCTVFSKSQMQPIFCSDGIIKNITIQNCVFMTKSQHHITLNGALNVTSQQNWLQTGEKTKELAKTVLNPARIGGGRNVWVLDFKNTHKYNKSIGDNITDNRRTEQRGTNIISLDVEEFNHEVARIPHDLQTNLRARRVASIALGCSMRA